MKNWWIVVVVAGAVICSSCARPEYWVKGLTLPPGSTVVAKSESKTEIEGAKTKFGQQPDGTLTINFDSTQSWDQVVAHIGGALKDAGFTENSRDLGDLGGFASKIPGIEKFMDATHTYTNEKGDYFVTLSNTKILGEAMEKVLSKLKGNKNTTPKGQYMLMIVKHSSGAAPPVNTNVPQLPGV